MVQAVIAEFAKRFEGLERQIEVIDVTTPATFAGHTGNERGFRFSISHMILALFAGQKLSQTLPGLENFYMVGQWAGMPGVPLVAVMGRDVVRQMCARDGKHFSADRLTSTGGIRDLTSVDGRVRSLPKTVDAAE